MMMGTDYRFSTSVKIAEQMKKTGQDNNADDLLVNNGLAKVDCG